MKSQSIQTGGGLEGSWKKGPGGGIVVSFLFLHHVIIDPYSAKGIISNSVEDLTTFRQVGHVKFPSSSFLSKRKGEFLLMFYSKFHNRIGIFLENG